jgi:hypothetical protein
MRVVGIILIVLGLIGLVVGGISYTRRREAVEIGPVSVAVRERETIPIPPILGGVALLAGVGLLVAAGRRRG